jgi:ABC-type transporter Mla subunit MlaD
VSLDQNIPPLPSDVIATLSSDTLLSPIFVALSAGTPGMKTLANNAIIEGHPAYGIQQITAAAGPLFDNANKLIDNLNGTVTDLKGDLGDLMPKFSSLADSLKIDIDNLQNVVTNLDSVAKTADSVLGSTGKFVSTTDTHLQELMSELRVVLLNLKVISTHAKAITETLGEKPGRLIFSGKANKLTPEAEIIKSREPVPAKKP